MMQSFTSVIGGFVAFALLLGIGQTDTVAATQGFRKVEPTPITGNPVMMHFNSRQFFISTVALARRLGVPHESETV